MFEASERAFILTCEASTALCCSQVVTRQSSVKSFDINKAVDDWGIVLSLVVVILIPTRVNLCMSCEGTVSLIIHLIAVLYFLVQL